MKSKSVFLFLVLLISLSIACKKEGFITSDDAALYTSADSLHFDTVFTTVGSITKLFKIFNPNDRKLLLDKLEMKGGDQSYFKINVNGATGTTFSNIEIGANDSIYVFVMVNINPSASGLPFIVQDSIGISYNGNNKFIQLNAYGQNAHFFRNKTITADTTWEQDLPIVIIGDLTIQENASLTINQGVQMYCHANAAILVNGSLKVKGEKDNKVVFQADRLDEPYKSLPGSWPGIYFNPTSNDNLLEYAVIKNAYKGLSIIQPSVNSNPKLLLRQCIIDNISTEGIQAINTSIQAENCLISNCGKNIDIKEGGEYNFINSTIVSYGNSFLLHKDPVVTISNEVSNALPNALTTTFSNSIIYGSNGNPEDEIQLFKTGDAPFIVTLNHCLYKAKSNVNNAILNNCLQNINPEFENIDISNHFFDFHLKPESPLIDQGFTTGLLIDLDGNNRNVGLPDIGCYEKQ